jgi:trimeric autotransporter adhesin
VVAARSGRFYGRAMIAGHSYTVAGDGAAGYSGDRGPARSAKLNWPECVAVDRRGDLVIADTDNQRVRLVAARSGRFYGRAMIAGDIYTVAGNGTVGFRGDGGPARSAWLNMPEGVVVDHSGNLVIAVRNSQRIRVVAVRSGRFYGRAMVAGDIYTVAGSKLMGYSGDGGPATSAGLHNPQGVAVDGSGNLVIADTNDQRIRVVAASSGQFYGQTMTAGDIYTVAGNGTKGFRGDSGPASAARLWFPERLTVDAAGNLIVADTFNGRIRVVAASSGQFYGRAMTAGDIYTVAGNGADNSGDGGSALSAGLSGPDGVKVDGSGNLIISANDEVRVVAARSGRFYGRAMIAGDIYTIEA